MSEFKKVIMVCQDCNGIAFKLLQDGDATVAICLECNKEHRIK